MAFASRLAGMYHDVMMRAQKKMLSLKSALTLCYGASRMVHARKKIAVHAREEKILCGGIFVRTVVKKQLFCIAE